MSRWWSKGPPTAQALLQSFKFFTDDRGIYRVYGLLSGQYLVAVDPKGFLSVMAAGSDLPLTYYPGVISKDEAQEVAVTAEISGRCELVGGRKIETVEGVTVLAMIEDDPLNQYTARPSSDGSFTLTRLPSGSYRILLRSEKSKYYLSRIIYEDADMTDEAVAIESGRKIAGLRLILSDESGTLRGVVIDRTGAVAAGATVMIVPLDAELRRSGRNNRAGLSDHRGSFLIEGIAPGKYRVFAVRDPKRSMKDKAALEELLSAHPEFLIIEVRAREVRQARVLITD